MTEISKEVQKVLSDDSGIAFEQIAGEESSPLNAPVIEKDIAGSRQTESSQIGAKSAQPAEDETESIENQEIAEEEPLDAPEQQIDEEFEDMPLDEEFESEPEFELPTAHAKQAADTFLGMADNFFEIGGGFFVKVKKHNDFYDFEEIVQVIDEHNDKNVKRLRLEKEDKALLRPLLIEVLKKKAQKLTPEQQLVGALISILIKKAQMVMEVRAENEILVDRILQVMKEEHTLTTEAEEEDPEEEDGYEEEIIEEPIIEEEPAKPQAITPESVLEIADIAQEEKK